MTVSPTTRYLMHRIKFIEEQVKMATRAYDDIKTLLSQLFTKEVLAINALDNFKMPTIEAYNGLSDPTDHLRRYMAQMEIA